MGEDTAAAGVTPWQNSFWRALDAGDIQSAWSQHCGHIYGRRYVVATTPWVTLAEIHDRLNWSQGLSQRIAAGFPLPVSDLPDVNTLLDLVRRPGAVLSGRDL
ncbi:MAG TPA: endonuclease MutS2, partial [Acidithiobacillus sp.]|nr:endonuclease MutS2 [Acidithiobacillus sp.]